MLQILLQTMCSKALKSGRDYNNPLYKKWFGSFLGPHWKVFHHGTLSKQFQGVIIAFGSRPASQNSETTFYSLTFNFR